MHEDSGAHRVTTSRLKMEAEAVTYAIQWLASQRDAQIAHTVILTDSVNLPLEPQLAHSHAQSSAARTCYFCGSADLGTPESVGMNGQIRLSSTADITSGLQLGRVEVLREHMDKPEHHSTDRLKERGVEKGSGQHSTLGGRERSVFNQTNIGTVSRATLGRLLRDGAERVWVFPSARMPSCAETFIGLMVQPIK